jgi:hypothetical protein
MASLTHGRVGIAILGIAALTVFTPAQAPNSAPNSAAISRTASEIRTWRESNEARVMDELRALLSIPNFASDTANIQRNADKLVEMLHARGFDTRLLPIAGRGPVVFGKLGMPGATRTIIFYIHYDGQSVDPANWHEAV